VERIVRTPSSFFSPRPHLAISDPQPLVDVHGRVFAVLVGQPRGNKYAASVAAAYDIITREGMAARFPAPMYKHRRGLFAAINVGISYGTGQSVPSWLQTPYDDLANRLLGNRDITRMATFASGAFPYLCHIPLT
jgi:hypothetical protein